MVIRFDTGMHNPTELINYSRAFPRNDSEKSNWAEQGEYPLVYVRQFCIIM